MLGPQETLQGGQLEQLEQRVEETIDVEDAARLDVNPELGPRDHLEELVQGSESARQHDKGVGLVGHRRLRRDDLQRRQAQVGDLLLFQISRDHSVHYAALGQHGVGEHAHQPDASTPVDQPDIAASQQTPQ